jgi:hypothetical protein
LRRRASGMGPSPFVPHGEGRSRSRCGPLGRVGGGAPSGSHDSPTSPKTAGGGWGWPTDRGSATDITLAPDRAPSPPAPLPREAGERGEFDPVSADCVRAFLPDTQRRIGARHLSPEVGGEAGRGGSLGRQFDPCRRSSIPAHPPRSGASSAALGPLTGSGGGNRRSPGAAGARWRRARRGRRGCRRASSARRARPESGRRRG